MKRASPLGPPLDYVFLFLWALAMLIACAVCARAQSAPNWLNVTAAHITTAGDQPLARGQLCFTGTDQNDNPISFQVGGGGQVLTQAVCTPITNGAIGANFWVANPCNTAPANIDYRIEVTAGYGNVLRYTAANIGCSSPFDFDNYVPNAGNYTGPSLNQLTVNDLTVTGACNFAGATGCGLTGSYLSATNGWTLTSFASLTGANNATVCFTSHAGQTCGLVALQAGWNGSSDYLNIPAATVDIPNLVNLGTTRVNTIFIGSANYFMGATGAHGTAGLGSGTCGAGCSGLSGCGTTYGYGYQWECSDSGAVCGCGATGWTASSLAVGAPSISTGAAAGSGTCSITGTDLDGSIFITGATTNGGGTVCTVTFGAASYANGVYPLLQSVSAASISMLRVLATGGGPFTGFAITVTNPGIAAGNYTLNYHAGGN